MGMGHLMALSEADKNFIAVTASMDPVRDKKVIYERYRETHPEAAELSDHQLAWRVKRMPTDAVQDEKERLAAVATAARGKAVAERAALAIKVQMALEEGDLDAIEAMREVVKDSEQSGSARSKAAEAFWKRRAQSPGALPVDTTEIAGRAVEEERLDAEIAVLVKQEVEQQVEQQVAKQPPAPEPATVFKGQPGGIA